MTRKALPIIASLVATVGIIVGAADAQTRRNVTLEASVPFEFVVGNRAFPAGAYVFEMATGTPKTSDQTAVLVVRSREHRLYAAVVTDVVADTNSHVGHKLIFVHAGDRVLLSQVWRQGSAVGLSVHTAPGAAEVEDWQQSEVLTLDAALTGGV